MNRQTSYSKCNMTSAGRITPVGAFGGMRVISATGGHDPQFRVTHGSVPGGPEVAVVNGIAGQKVDRREDSVKCPNGLYLEVVGGPRRFEVEILWR